MLSLSLLIAMLLLRVARVVHNSWQGPHLTIPRARRRRSMDSSRSVAVLTRTPGAVSLRAAMMSRRACDARTAGNSER
jgi:hypothetical protein